jgi:hypothetical protein
MSRKTLAAATAISLIALGACARGDDNMYDTAGATAGAMATPPAPIGMSVGATTSVMDSITADSIRRADSLRRRDTTKTP